ncbi:UPF0175 family protein [Mucilaginibacter myungsuensis]|uniref:UPF0175 family protein n=1 Tax=Mucilaginibacter myungsuensis TaxID=649104 RepID=A0A929KY42_9SPHI|nr:UPF0175 family protein [Mucilaginibacter myungsuensis]MBE9662593.1 UPF0175 family protein [Mucilaginibacter myungsuensis]MDN3598013.1 UPF0175 family protein [Mucilaginibacter myungsuensis]
MSINLPEGLKVSEQDVLTALATRLYDTGKVTIEQAAGLVGCTTSTFIEELTAQSLQESATATYLY